MGQTFQSGVYLQPQPKPHTVQRTATPKGMLGYGGQPTAQEQGEPAAGSRKSLKGAPARCVVGARGSDSGLPWERGSVFRHTTKLAHWSLPLFLDSCQNDLSTNPRIQAATAPGLRAEADINT
ncbi:hypothetical protein AAFF_G00241560 [Aldrovandia affinis]|uniref:Uncharacterized protein n=1 Tax=Aldrovandia affinis TaxID=143900 RepID=A0AAD7SUY2_9TELE|nr:hypothetical protein AAFF_G00241560 [Aldrovandia affinis]